MAMKPGNLSQTVWRRSVGKQFHDQKRDGVSDLTRDRRSPVCHIGSDPAPSGLRRRDAQRTCGGDPDSL